MSTSSPNSSAARHGTARRSGAKAVSDLPARQPYAFWSSAAFVLIVGTLLATRNYSNHGRMKSRLDVDSTRAAQAGQRDGIAASNGTTEFEASPAASTQGDDNSRFPKLCLSLAIVVLASVAAGFSMAQLLSRPASGFHSIADAERNLTIPVLGAVPMRDWQQS
jgi:hypothetical protein